MFEKKLNFWRLAFIYGGLTFVILVLLWMSPLKSIGGDMNNGMGNMMKSEHYSNITLYDLFAKEELKPNMKQAHLHHQGQSFVVKSMGNIVTSLIFIITPFIIAGSIALAIIWIR